MKNAVVLKNNTYILMCAVLGFMNYYSSAHSADNIHLNQKRLWIDEHNSLMFETV